MNHNRASFLRAFRDAVSERGLKFTRQREAIADVIFSGEKHLTLDDILLVARKNHASVGYATVYRTMKLLVECGLVVEHKFSDGQARYERESDEHHDHMICVKCGKIVEFEDEQIEMLQHKLAEDLGFILVTHRHEIYIICDDESCRS